jgi:hypothetical protein
VRDELAFVGGEDFAGAGAGAGDVAVSEPGGPLTPELIFD